MLSLSSSNHRSKGFTLIELLVVISIIAVLAAMLLPTISIVRELARSSQCGSNQKQMVGAMVAYSTSEETSWPDPRLPTATAIADANSAAIYTAHVFELLAAAQDIQGGLFKCPSASTGGPNKQLNASMKRVYEEGASASAWGWTGANKVNYAFDWASPADATSSRVLLADRDLNHKEAVMAAFGDGHSKKLKAVKTPVVAGETVGAIKPNPEFAVHNPDARGAHDQESDAAALMEDNIFDRVGDTSMDTFGLAPGAGHSKRAWVK